MPVSIPKDVVTDDSIQSEPPIEPSCLGPRLSSLDGDLFEQGHSINDFKFIVETILGQREDSPLCKPLKRDGFDDFIGIATVPEQHIKNLKCEDDSSGNIVMVELDQDCRALARCFKAFVRMKIDKGKPIHQDWQNLTIKANFQECSV
jgi:hypothetical protein